MRANISLDANDLATIMRTATPPDADGELQIALGGRASVTFAYLTLNEVRDVANAWMALADSLDPDTPNLAAKAQSDLDSIGF